MNKKKRSIVSAFVSLFIVFSLQGCSKIVLLDPKGPVGHDERSVIIYTVLLVLIVVIPVLIMTFWFPIKYRESNDKAPYVPTWCGAAKIEIAMWLIPILIVLALSVLTWRGTYGLDPYKPIRSDVPPLEVQVVSLDWKWLFIYPKQGIATVNQLVFPANVPLSFRLTSDTVMSSFFIPQLGSQIYTMPGMQTRLHLLAQAPGVYAGQNQQFSGRGFSEMNFQAIATSKEEFESFVEKARQSPDRLDSARFEALRQPSVKDPVAYFSWVEPGMFDHIRMITHE